MAQHISPVECTKWLRDRNMIEAPYGSKEIIKSKYCDQHKISQEADFSSNVIAELTISNEALLVFMDWHFNLPEEWHFYPSHQLPLLEMMQSTAYGQTPNFDRGLGFLYTSDQRSDLVLHVKSAIELGWSVYLYPDSANTILYFWEGVLLDVWSNSKTTFSNIEKVCDLKRNESFLRRLFRF